MQKKKEDGCLPLNFEDLPNIKPRLTEAQEDQISQAPKEEIEVATKFLKELQNLLQAKVKDLKNKEEIQNLYDYSFNKLSSMVFPNSCWTSPQEIENKYPDLEIDITSQFLYKELSYRHVYARLSNFSAELRFESWENYKQLFQVILYSKDDIELPPQWIWDILDEFLYQFQVNCQWRGKLKEEEFKNYREMFTSREFWNLADVQKILNDLVLKSMIFKMGKTPSDPKILQDIGKNPQMIHYFGYFSLVSLLRLNALNGKPNDALTVIEQIDFKKLLIFSKAYPSYISLLFFCGSTYFMVGKYYATNAIFEALIIFHNKYKQFFQKYFLLFFCASFFGLLFLFFHFSSLHFISFYFLATKPL